MTATREGTGEGCWPLDLMEFNGTLMGFHRNLMGFHRNLMGFHRNLMGFNGIS